MNKTPIEWVRTYAADGTWTPGYTVNPIRARWKDGRNGGRPFHYCQKISAGCKNCYSSRFQPRFGGLPFDETAKAALDAGEIEIYLDEQVIEKVLRFRKTAACFPFDMTDLFGDWVPDEMIDIWWGVMALTPNVTYRILTKRADRMLAWSSREWEIDVPGTCIEIAKQGSAARESEVWSSHSEEPIRWPLPNVQLGVSAENQETLCDRVGLLTSTPAAKRFISYEPALGPVNLKEVDVTPRRKPAKPPREYGATEGGCDCALCRHAATKPETEFGLRPILTPWELNVLNGEMFRGGVGYKTKHKIDWVIAGGESGPGARPPHPDWFRSVRDQCVAAGVPFFFKQWGNHIPFDQRNVDIPEHWKGHPKTVELSGRVTKGEVEGWATFNQNLGLMPTYEIDKHKAGRELDGREWNEFPMS